MIPLLLSDSLFIIFFSHFLLVFLINTELFLHILLKVLYNYYANFVNRFLEFFNFNFQKAYISGIFGALYNYKTRVAIMRVTRISACSFFKKNNVLYNMVIGMEKNFENLVYGEALKHIRKQNKLTQEDVARLTGLEAKYISQIECGLTKGTINTLLKFCEAYNVTPNEILHSFLKPTTSNMKIEKLLENVAKMAKRDKEVIFSLAEILAKKNS